MKPEVSSHVFTLSIHEMKDRSFTFRVEGSLVEKARALGLNISEICRNALREAVEQGDWCGRRDSNPGLLRGRQTS